MDLCLEFRKKRFIFITKTVISDGVKFLSNLPSPAVTWLNAKFCHETLDGAG